MINNVRNVIKIAGLGLLLSSCTPRDTELVISPIFRYQQRDYSCSGYENAAREYERISIFRRDTPEIVPIIHYWRDSGKIEINNGNLDIREAKNLLSICEEELEN
ncbi:hypothetical protein HZC31_06710 [Candidatus Woesearchaeota archaeon]|nr:hypothetical protein [Candidatus Woesearchaeota archaeon]